MTVSKLKRHRYSPVSRNPLLASYLSYYQHIEQRGRGIQMMTEAMINHGLPEPDFRIVDNGLFEMTLIGPGTSSENLKARGIVAWRIPDATKARLNKRQKAVIKHLHETGSVTSGWCREEFKVTYDTANRDLKQLAELGILLRRGQGRSTHYVLVEQLGHGE